MKRKRFYKNKKRGTKWTEQPKGRKISFADKYIENSVGTDKYENRRFKPKKPFFTAEKGRTALKNLIIFACCFLIVGVGYTAMDFYMERKSMPERQEQDSADVSISSMNLRVKAFYTQPISFDADIMLRAVMEDALQNGFTSIAFDGKRPDGTIGYESNLATIGAYGAVSSPASDLKNTISVQKENDILPAAILSCYKDNTATAADSGLAVMRGKTIYRDIDGYAYLNPDSDSTYRYLKSIIDELKNMGITVFILNDYDLPEEISGSYNDGYKTISEKLEKDFNGEIKLLQAVNIDLSETKNGDLRQELEDRLGKTDDNRIYFITCTDLKKVKGILDKTEVSNYIIAQ